MNKMVQITSIRKGAAYDIAGNRYALGGNDNVTEGCYIAYREQVVTKRKESPDSDTLVDLEPAAYWTNRIISAVFATEADAVNAMNSSEMLNITAEIALLDARGKLQQAKAEVVKKYSLKELASAAIA